MYRWLRKRMCKLTRLHLLVISGFCIIFSMTLTYVQLFGGEHAVPIIKYADPVKVLSTQSTTVRNSSEHQHIAQTTQSTWINKRKMLMKKKNHISKVLLYTYMRGGSSVFSQIFNIDQRSTVLFFESLDSFYRSHFGLRLFSLPMAINYYRNLTRRIPGEFELSEMTTFLENLLSCNIDKVPVELLAHRQFLEQADIFKDMVRICIPSRSGNHSLYWCTNYLGDICGGEDLVRPNITHAITRRCPDIIHALKLLKPVESYSTLAVKNIHAQLTQQLGKLPDDINLKPFLEHHHCIANLESQSRACWKRFGQNNCNRAKLIVAKLTRASLPNLHRLIERIPDIRLIYYTRDPRATAVSRVQNGSRLMSTPRDRNPVLEARALCAQMREDLIARKDLETKYPGAILTIRYEDFISDTYNVTRKVFEYVGRPVPDRFSWWAKDALHGNIDNGMFGRRRTNATVAIVKWKTMVSQEAAVNMTDHCRDVLESFGYDI